MTAPDPILLVTALLDTESFARFDGLRRRYFPPERNKIPAHIALFHKLPGGDETSIIGDLTAIGAAHTAFPFAVDQTMLLGRGGTGFTVTAPELLTLRGQLAGLWSAHLSRQDAQGYRPHITIQNKVTLEQAAATQRDLDQLLPLQGRIEGLLLWYYHDGPWELAKNIKFPNNI